MAQFKPIIALMLLTLGGCSTLPGLHDSRIIPQGRSQIDFNQDGIPETILRVSRETYNAHAYFVITFYDESRNDIQLIPITGRNKDLDSLTTQQGADCTLRDYWLIPNNGKLALLEAARNIGASYSSDTSVTFSFFTLEENADQEPGLPRFYLKHDRSWTTKKSYCDVHDAVRSEIQ